MFDSLTQGIRRNGPSRPLPSSSSSTLPLYSPIAADTLDASPPSSPSSSSTATGALLLQPAQLHAAPSSTWLGRPTLSRFLADFTLGFADGLTVPFALTAGLSSLGRTDTVIFAGLAEICAGSISMGIGGYLSARGEASAAAADALAREEEDAEEEEEEEEMKTAARPVEEKTAMGAQGVTARYLAPLDLPPELLDLVRAHVSSRADVAAALEREAEVDEDHDDDDDDDDTRPSPVLSGASVALGYLIGGSLPLAPYFAVGRVGDGLLWSFVVCIIALFAFGFTKDFVLHRQQQRQLREVVEVEGVFVKDKMLRGTRRGWGWGWGWGWRDVRRSAWEGTQMVMLGSMAALAAVLCVRLFDGMGRGDGPQP